METNASVKKGQCHSTIKTSTGERNMKTDLRVKFPDDLIQFVNTRFAIDPSTGKRLSQTHSVLSAIRELRHIPQELAKLAS